MHVSVLVYPLIIFESSGLFQSSVMKLQNFQGIWVLTNFLKIKSQIDEQKMLMLPSWGKAAAWTYTLWGSRESMEVRAAVNNTPIQKSFSPRSCFYAPQIHKKTDLIHSTPHTIICLIFAGVSLHFSVRRLEFSPFPTTSEESSPRCFWIWPVLWVRGSGSCDSSLWN